MVARLPAERLVGSLALLRASSFEDRALLGRFIAGAYPTSPEAMQRLAYPGFETLTSEVGYGEIIAAVEPILARGPCYRAV